MMNIKIKTIQIIVYIILIICSINLITISGKAINKNINFYEDSYSWLMYQHDSAHTGFSESRFPNNISLLWEKGYNDDYFSQPYFLSSPVVTKDKVFYLGGNFRQAKIFSLNENNGSLIWKTYINESAFIIPYWFNTPAFHNGKLFIYICSVDGTDLQSRTKISNSQLIALDENTGNIIWNKTLQGTAAVFSSVMASDGKVVIGGHVSSHIPLSRIYVFNESNGSLLWKSKTFFGFIESTPLITENLIIVASGWIPGPYWMYPSSFHPPIFHKKSMIYAFNLHDGTESWEQSVDGHVLFSSPTATNNRLFVPSNIIYNMFKCDCRITALDLNTGEKIWYYTIECSLNRWPTTISNPSVSYDKVFVIVADGRIFSFNETNGNVIWTKKILDNIPNKSSQFTPSEVPPVLVDNKIICQAVESDNLRDTYHICLLNESTGELIYDLILSQDPSYAPFSIANQKVFMHKSYDEIYAFG